MPPNWSEPFASAIYHVFWRMDSRGLLCEIFIEIGNLEYSKHSFVKLIECPRQYCFILRFRKKSPLSVCSTSTLKQKNKMKWNFLHPQLNQVGLIGFIIYLPFSFYVGYRLYRAFTEKANFEKKKNRMMFHSLMFLYVFLELICLINMWATNDFNFASVLLHTTATFCNISAFAMVYYRVAQLIFRLNSNDQKWVFYSIMLVLSVSVLSDISIFTVLGKSVQIAII